MSKHAFMYYLCGYTFDLNFTVGLCSFNAPCFVLSSFWLEILLYILFSLTFFKDDIHVFWLICYYIIAD
jgi:hypothetical protein